MMRKTTTRVAPDRREIPRTTTANNTSVHGRWHTDVGRFEVAISQLAGPVASASVVSFFELPSDSQLHVNVTHAHQTVAVKGWAGPAVLPHGFVYNRRFEDGQRILPHIRQMIFAERA
jgi:hypothetical protein